MIKPWRSTNVSAATTDAIDVEVARYVADRMEVADRCIAVPGLGANAAWCCGCIGLSVLSVPSRSHPDNGDRRAKRRIRKEGVSIGGEVSGRA